MVKIGHARISERGTVEGTAGDQTTHEVEVSNWYSGGWQAVFRPNDPDRAEIIAKACECACKIIILVIVSRTATAYIMRCGTLHRQTLKQFQNPSIVIVRRWSRFASLLREFLLRRI